MADTVTGLHGVVGVLAALRLRDELGVGQHIDMAMIDAMAFTDDYLPNEVAAARARRRREEAGASGDRATTADDAGADHLRASPNEIIDAPGGPVIVMGEFKWIWKSIHERLRCRRPDAARRLARRQGGGAPAGLARLLARPSPPAPSCWRPSTGPTWRGGSSTAGADALSSPTLAHRGSVVEIDDPDDPYAVVRAPYRFSAAEAGVRAGRRARASTAAEILADWLGEVAPSRDGRRRRQVRWAASASARSTSGGEALAAALAGAADGEQRVHLHLGHAAGHRVGGDGEVRVAGRLQPLHAQPLEQLGRGGHAGTAAGTRSGTGGGCRPCSGGTPSTPGPGRGARRRRPARPRSAASWPAR